MVESVASRTTASLYVCPLERAGTAVRPFNWPASVCSLSEPDATDS